MHGERGLRGACMPGERVAHDTECVCERLSVLLTSMQYNYCSYNI